MVAAWWCCIPSGYIAAQQGQLVVISTLLMLLIIVPVIVMTLVFAWRYRASNTAARYTPDWDHSIQLELVIWAAPLLIIIAWARSPGSARTRSTRIARSPGSTQRGRYRATSSR